MTIREETQAIERQTLSRYATLSQSTRGRRRPEDEDPIRPCYQRTATALSTARRSAA